MERHEMTKRDFEAIASVIRGLNMAPADKQIVAEAFATFLRTTNPQFNSARFLGACADHGY